MNPSLLSHVSLLAILMAASQAAQITWTAHDVSPGDGTADVSTEGTLVEARNGALIDVTVNGVTFQSIENSGNLFDSLFSTDTIKYREGTNPTGNYRTFLQLGQRSGRPKFGPETKPERIPPTKDWATVHLTGLTIGHTYQIQIWASAVDNLPSTARNHGLLLGNGSAGAPDLSTDTMLLLEVQDGVGKPGYGTGGQYGIGTFVADATTQSFNVQGWRNLLSNPQAMTSDHFSNGWQLRDLGEGGPHAAALASPTTKSPANAVPPRLVKLQSTDTTLTLQFSQPMNKAAVTDVNNYTISLKGGGSGSIASAALGSDGRTVTLKYGIPLFIDGSTYVIEFGNLTGADGAPMTGKKAVEFSP